MSKAADQAWAAYSAALGAIYDRVDAAIRAAGMRAERVIYSAYRTLNDKPADNLDKVAVRGRVRLIGKRHTFFGGPRSRTYCSGVLESPTWLQVAVEANRMMGVVRDAHHRYLEGLTKLPKAEQTELGVVLYAFCMGS